MTQLKWLVQPIMIFIFSIITVAVSLILYIYWYVEISSGLKTVIQKANLDPDQVLAPQTWVVILILSILVGIILMGTFKGLVAGIVMGLIARKMNSVPLGIAIGTLVGLGLALPVAMMVGQYFWEIMLPGGLVGTIVGYATQSFGVRPKLPASG